MEEEIDIPDEGGDACPCKRQKVTTSTPDSKTGADNSMCHKDSPSHTSHTDYDDLNTASTSVEEQSMLQSDLHIASNLHLGSNLNLGDDLQLNNDVEGRTGSSLFDSETGESSYNDERQPDILRQHSERHLHSNSASQSRHSIEVNSATAAVAENNYIKSVDRSMYGHVAGKLEGRSGGVGSESSNPEIRSVSVFPSEYGIQEKPSTSQLHRNQEKTSLSTVHVSKPRNRPFLLDTSAEMEKLSDDGLHINKLPTPVMLHLFRYFSTCTLLRRTSLVCKYWYNLSRDPDLWRNILIRNQHRLTDDVLKELVLFSDRVLQVDLTDCRFVTDVGIRGILSSCSHLRTLKLMRCYEVTDESFVGFGSRKLCPNLRVLHLDHCYNITDHSVIEIAECCQHIQELHLNQCTKVTDRGVQAVARQCYSLKELLLDHCDKVTDHSAGELSSFCPLLQYLNVMCCGISDSGVKEFAKLTSLRSLDLSNIPRLTPTAVIHVATSCKLLECVNISLNVVMNDQCVSAIARNCQKLKRLYCVSCSITDKGLQDLARFRPTLEALDIGWCQDITDDGIRVISHACKNLGYLGLIRCDRISYEAVKELVLIYPHINYSTFILESERLLERARLSGYHFNEEHK